MPGGSEARGERERGRAPRGCIDPSTTGVFFTWRNLLSGKQLGRCWLALSANREERELTSGGDNGLPSWIRDPLIGQLLTVGPA